MNKGILSLFITALVLIFTGSVYAASTTSTLNVTTTIIAGCTVSTTAVDFGTHDGSADVYLNGDVTVNCSSGTAYNIALDAGLNYSGSYRRITDGTNYIIYYLDKDGTFGSYWGDSDFDNTYSFGSSLADTGDGTDQAHTVYGWLRQSTSPAGTYTDTVTVTVYY